MDRNEGLVTGCTYVVHIVVDAFIRFVVQVYAFQLGRADEVVHITQKDADFFVATWGA